MSQDLTRLTELPIEDACRNRADLTGRMNIVFELARRARVELFKATDVLACVEGSTERKFGEACSLARAYSVLARFCPEGIAASRSDRLEIGLGGSAP